jgi:hypothetical protein
MMNRAGAEVTGQAGGGTGGAADCAKADGGIARTMAKVEIHLEIMGIEAVAILDHFRVCFHQRVLRAAPFSVTRVDFSDSLSCFESNSG